MIIYCFWYSKSLFPVIPWLPLAPITMPTQFSCSFSCRCLRASSCWLKANVPWEILMHWNIPYLYTALSIPHSPCMHCRRTRILQKDWKCGTDSCQWSWCLHYLISPGWRVSPRETVSAEADMNWLFNNEEAQCLLFCYSYAYDMILRAHIQCWDYCLRLPLKSCRSSSPLNSCCFCCMS